ncbi:hypothetical protein DSBG_2926 [Desulfosporosinus sp. BG]|nr:hypothetical protein DSBG_2926 [Desulfosporosinus sp. BG]
MLTKLRNFLLTCGRRGLEAEEGRESIVYCLRFDAKTL